MTSFDQFSRQNRRWQGYDYRSEGLYFVTICTHQRQPFFGRVLEEQMHLSEAGKRVHACWLEIPSHWSQVELSAFVVMPNHVHGILRLDTSTGSGKIAMDLTNEIQLGGTPEIMASISSKTGSISRIIGSFKAACTRQINRLGISSFAWQPRFHDRVIRHQKEWILIEAYILSNPSKWPEDRFFVSG